MYYILFLLMLVFLILEVYTLQIRRNIFLLIYFLLSFVVIFRYGQGTDYFNYMIIYNASEHVGSWVFDNDVGFAYICHFFYNLGIPYPIFSSIVALVTMILFFRFFNSECRRSMIPLFIFYSYIFLIYPMSGIRQGLTLAILLGVLYPLLKERRYFLYYVILILASSLHLSLLICALLPILVHINLSKKKIVLLFFVSVFFMALSFNPYDYLPVGFDRGATYADDESSINWIPKLFRVIIIAVIVVIPGHFLNDNLKILRTFLIFGFFFYSFFSFSDTIAARLETYFRVFEMVFLVLLMYESRHRRSVARYVMVFCLLYSVLWVKNIQSQLQQGRYKDQSILSYRYISIFDPDEINVYRSNFSDRDFAY